MPAPRPVDDLVRELLANGARHDDLHMQRARRDLAHAVARGHDAIASGAFSAWLRLWRDDVHSAFVVDAAEQESYQRLARAGLRLDHQLAGPDRRTVGPAIAVGDHLNVRATVRLGTAILERGACLQVTGIDHRTGRAHLAAPADGVATQLSLNEPAWRHVEHAYAELVFPRHGRAVASGLAW
jgi:hypothetical protein